MKGWLLSCVQISIVYMRWDIWWRMCVWVSDVVVHRYLHVCVCLCAQISIGVGALISDSLYVCMCEYGSCWCMCSQEPVGVMGDRYRVDTCVH
jgi:hypothetical protein